ncbi:hypothetical protein HMPREF9946_04546 [Acetobacteraceae bacterium AT-5844]|nr:hypothetical protein HMPREF9946_04546 [Acetobacteraceae bacterium AT-5844]
MRVGVNGYPLATGPLPAFSALLRKHILPARPALLALALLGLSGCGALQSDQSGSATPVAAAIPVQPDDPLAAFAARANPGQEELVGNPPVRARMMRTYNSGAGRPCREVMLGNAATGTKSLYCEVAPGVWTHVRPLLGTGQTGRS